MNIDAKARLREIITDLNDTSPECLAAIDSLRTIELEEELAALRAQLAAAQADLRVAHEALDERDRLRDQFAAACKARDIELERATHYREQWQKAQADTRRLDWITSQDGTRWLECTAHYEPTREEIDAAMQEAAP